MTTEEFCISLMLMEHPGCSDATLLQKEIHRVLKETIPINTIKDYLDKKLIESTDHERESRKINHYYTVSSDEIFNDYK
jgi:DNA-binding MarR family transcriptional regulator